MSRYGYLASLYANNSAVSSSYGLALKKVKTVTTSANGLSRAGLDELCKVRVTQGHSAAREMRTEMADNSLALYYQLAQLGTASITFDNLDTTVAGVQHHLTQGFTVFELDPVDPDLDIFNEMGVNDAKNLFTLEHMDIGSEKNRQGLVGFLDNGFY